MITKKKSKERIEPSTDTLLVEYATTNDAYIHYDNFSWQVGAILIAGAFIFWGFLLNIESESTILNISSILIALLMSIWYLYTNHNRQIYLCKLHRLYEIEETLGMEQHRGWKGDNPKYRTFGINGHLLDLLVYVLISQGTPIIAIVSIGLSIWQLVPVFINIICIIWAIRDIQALKNYLKSSKKII